MTDGDDKLDDLRKLTESGDRLDEVGEGENGEEGGSGNDTASEEDREENREASEEPAATGSRDQRNESAVASEARASPSESTEISVSDTTEKDALVTAIDAKLDELEGNQRSVHIWNGHIAATIAVIESHPELKDEVVAALESQSRTEIEIDSQSEFLGLILRVGLEEVAPEVMAALREAIKQRALRDL